MLAPTTATVTNTLKIATQRLAAANCDTPQLDAAVLLAHTLKKDKSWLYLYPHAHLEQSQLDTFFALIARREAREPVAYITGQKAFFALEFVVNPHVLIPRPETELLVETALELARNNNGQSPFQMSQKAPGAGGYPPLSPSVSGSTETLPNENLIVDNHNKHLLVADVGTGSGCIAVSLAKHLPQAKIYAIDISVPALQVARQNGLRHGVSSQITFLAGNLLAPVAGPVDLIVSNPPYVGQPALAWPGTMPEVRRYEPRLALNGGPDGLVAIKKLLSQARAKLKPGGSLLVEIGAGQGEAVTQLAKTHFPQAKVQIKKDLAGLDRLLIVN